MLWEGYFVISTILISLCILVTDKIPTETVFFSNLILFWNFNIINSEEALSGFSNKGLIAIGSLYILVYPLNNNKYVIKFIKKVFHPTSEKRSLLQISIIISLLSAFLNNTPLITLITPIIRRLTRQAKYPTSRFLMPISFASIIGGSCTLIGTSTNLVINSLLPNNISISFFELTPIASIFLLTYLLYLPVSQSLLSLTSGLYRETKRSFIIYLKSETEELIHKILNENQIEFSDLLGILNDETEIISYNTSKITDKYRLYKTNSLVIKSDNINEIIQNKKYFIKDVSITNFKNIYEVVIGNIHKQSISEFQNKYNCHIIAQRQIKSTLIQRGDTLLILSDKNFSQNWMDTQDFYMISNYDEINSKDEIKPLIIFLAVILLTAFNIYPIEKASVTGVILYIFLSIVDIKDAFKLVDFNLLLIIGSSFAISKAMINSKLSLELAKLITNINASPFAIYFIFILVAQILTEVITNNAVASLLTQIAVDITQLNNYNTKTFILGLMLSCSSSFLTPYGYATNLIVKGPGGYKFKDYIKFGLPVKILSLLNCLLIAVIYGI